MTIRCGPGNPNQCLVLPKRTEAMLSVPLSKETVCHTWIDEIDKTKTLVLAGDEAGRHVHKIVGALEATLVQFLY